MVHRSKVINGLVGYVDEEIVAKMNGSWKAWVVGGAAGLVAARADRLMAALSDNQMIRALGLMDGENVDIEAIYAEMLKQAKRGSATIDVPLVGPVTFGVADVESLYRHIMGA